MLINNLLVHFCKRNFPFSQFSAKFFACFFLYVRFLVVEQSLFIFSNFCKFLLILCQMHYCVALSLCIIYRHNQPIANLIFIYFIYPNHTYNQDRFLILHCSNKHTYLFNLIFDSFPKIYFCPSKKDFLLNHLFPKNSKF